MKKRLTIATLLFILLTTITSQKKIFIDNFNLRKIEIENNFLLKDNDIKKSLKSIYNKNLLTLNYKEIEQ